MADNIPTYSLRFNSAGEWEIKKDGYTKALGFYLAKVRAVASAKGMAKANGGQLYVHGKDGKVQNKFDYSGRFRSQLPEVSTDTPMPPVNPPKPDPNKGSLHVVESGTRNAGLLLEQSSLLTEIDKLRVLVKIAEKEKEIYFERYLALKNKSLWQRIKDVFVYE